MKFGNKLGEQGWGDYFHLACGATLLFSVSAVILWRLSALSMWGDEVWSVRVASHSWRRIVELVAADKHPPLYFWLLGMWTRWVGASDFSSRLLSALFTVASVPMVYVIGRMVASKGAAILAMVLFGLAGQTVLWGRMARYYSMTLFLALVAVILVTQLNRRGMSLRLMIGYTIVATLLCYTNYLCAGAIILGSTFFMVWQRRYLIWPWMAINCLVGLLVLPVLWIIMRQAVPFTLVDGQAHVSLAVWIQTAAFVLYVFLLGQTVYPCEILPVACAGVAFATSLYGHWVARRWTRVENNRTTSLIMWIVVATAILLVLISRQLPSRFPFSVGRLVFFLSPFFFIWFARGLISLPKGLMIGAMCLILVADTFALGNYFKGRHFLQYGHAMPTNDIIQFIKSEKGVDDIVVYWHSSLPYYHGADKNLYWFREGPPNRAMEDWIERHQFDADSIIRSLGRVQPPGVWLVAPTSDQMRVGCASERIRQWLLTHYKQVRIVGYLPEDPWFSAVKSRLAQRQVYSYKISLYHFSEPNLTSP